ncbi:MAG: peptidylprolyl isomerase [Thermoleophilia bacterium]
MAVLRPEVRQAAGLGRGRPLVQKASAVYNHQEYLAARTASGRPKGALTKTESEETMAKAQARHILVDSQEKCEQIKIEIVEGADFAEMAKVYSSCPSGQRGGDLGEFSPGQMVREFDEVVFSADLNTVQGPVKTQFGYHLIEVTSRTD